MRMVDRKFEQLVLVCVNERTDGRECCAHKNSTELYEKLKAAVKVEMGDKGGQRETDGDKTSMKVRVSKCGCLDHCQTGITVALMPRNVYLGEVTEEDIPEIIRLIAK